MVLSALGWGIAAPWDFSCGRLARRERALVLGHEAFVLESHYANGTTAGTTVFWQDDSQVWMMLNARLNSNVMSSWLSHSTCRRHGRPVARGVRSEAVQLLAPVVLTARAGSEVGLDAGFDGELDLVDLAGELLLFPRRGRGSRLRSSWGRGRGWVGDVVDGAVLLDVPAARSHAVAVLGVVGNRPRLRV